MRKNYILRPDPIHTAMMARFIAKIIDVTIAILLAFFLYPFGVLIATFFLALCDSLQHGQSIGKRFIGFSVISLIDGTPCSFKQSAIRNLPFIVPMTVAIIPFWGQILAVLVGIPLIGLEIYLLLKLDSGNRLGDVMADTTVVVTTLQKVGRSASAD